MTINCVRNSTCVIWLILFFPVGLYLMWKRTPWNKTLKWVITAFFVLMSLPGLFRGESDSGAGRTRVANSEIGITEEANIIVTENMVETTETTLTAEAIIEDTEPPETEEVVIHDPPIEVIEPYPVEQPPVEQPPIERPWEEQAQAQAGVVYWGETGTKIHKYSGCRTLGEFYYSGTEEEAIAAGRTEGYCKVCS
ncbi:MAG: hypothetical protein FWH07_04495 [Oscillospiraceae bacterium]|nr:hypothetical protein [Oscillospiraceae bacterium]